MGSVGDAYDNAVAESFLSTLKNELPARRRFLSQAEVGRACFSCIEGFYNPLSRQSALRYRSPVDYKREIQPDRFYLGPVQPSPLTVHKYGVTSLPDRQAPQPGSCTARDAEADDGHR